VHPQETQEENGSPEVRRPPRVVGAIPARYGSTRLPAKALVLLAGRPMIEHVWRRAAAAPGLARLVVLTDDERIADAVRAFDGEVEMTPVDCASGTDRIAWAARGWDCDAVINIQGDEPLIDPDGIGRLAEHLTGHPEDPVVTLATAAEPGDPANPAAVKVVLDRRGYALYFSRAGIPFPRQAEGASPLRHLGIYGYQRTALLALAALEATPLERAESLEQLRALEHGVPIRVLLGARPSWGVDTAEDVAAMERRLATISASGGNR
jgi:3-deoxy-manno-octulosonate cytidylyltransferase (CMP-KDO synthetase)